METGSFYSKTPGTWLWDDIGSAYDPQKETFFVFGLVFDLTDSVAAYQREAHYGVMDH